ncbi:MAG: AAA family ATPase [Bryobacteraceae bacterium]|nr:AAA family ATPase [Bryobacteraceae bacterium]
MQRSASIQRVRLKNYKSFAAADVTLRDLTFLVGPNGSGKSNFLDALRFVADSLRGSVEHALRERGGIQEVRRRSGGHPNHFGIRLDMTLGDGSRAYYAFTIAARPSGGFEVQTEECAVQGLLEEQREFRVSGGRVTGSLRTFPAVLPDRLFLVNASGLPEFRPVYDALAAMSFHNLNPDVIRDLQQPDSGEILARDGSNIASVVKQLSRRHPPAKARIEEYLAKVVPGVRGVESRDIGPKETLEFKQDVAGSKAPWRFLAANMSDGTLRALGILVALFHSWNGESSKVTLVGIEEPEIALHPAAAGLLFDALTEASRRVQVLVTSHSPDLLDRKEINSDSILAVSTREGGSRIAGIDGAGRAALRDQLYTAGELLRADQLTPDPEAVSQAAQVNLFE